MNVGLDCCSASAQYVTMMGFWLAGPVFFCWDPLTTTTASDACCLQHLTTLLHWVSKQITNSPTVWKPLFCFHSHILIHHNLPPPHGVVQSHHCQPLFVLELASGIHHVLYVY